MISPVNARTCRRLAPPLTCLLIAACATQPGLETSGSLPVVAAPDHAEAVKSAREGREKAITAYRDYLARYPDGPEHDRVTRRLADLLVEDAADMRLDAATSLNDALQLEATARQSCAEAIGYYEYLLARYPDAPETTELLYQLSRAYQANGRSQQALTAIDRLLVRKPGSSTRLYADTWFRRGELLFSKGAYPEAGRSYQVVVDLGAAVPSYEQALYKLGWSLFKQDQYAAALPVLFDYLDRKIPPGAAFEVQLQRLTLADQEQVADVFRVISKSFAQLGGADSVNAYFERHGSRSYEDHVYLDLAAFYVEQEQVTEAATTWLVLAQRAPLGPESPRLVMQAISLYREAGFQQRVVETEALFVQEYGSGSEFWTLHPEQDFPDVLQVLQSSLQELARSAHEQAHESGDAGDYRAAEQWYRDYLAAFGDTEGAADMNFQLAELLYENGRYLQAIDEYERAAWSYGDHAHAADAALGALRAANKVLQHDAATGRPAVAERATADALRFATTWPEHPAAPGVLAQAGTALLEQRQYQSALRAGEQVLDKTVAAPPALRQAAWSMQAQAQYELEDYPAAAAAYREALQLAGEDDQRRPALQEGLAAATYKQAEQASTLGDSSVAVTLYRQAAQLVPGSSIGAKAEYDAATTLLAEASWTQAIRMLEQFRRDYPDDPLQAEAGRKLAYAYDRSGQGGQAAAEYLRLGEDRHQTAALQREALLRAADLYAQAGAVAQAIGTCELYLQRFPEPATPAVEVMQRLARLEAGAGNNSRRLHWLEEIIRLDHAAGAAGTRAPAAEAALDLAEIRLDAFLHVQLVNPVQDNLARKLQAMQQALQAFEAAIAYGVAPVTTAATYRIASMYERLGIALLQSERPASLSAAELEEYNSLLAEQAAPFEQQAIEIYTANARRSGGDQHDPWVEKSVQRLVELQAGR